MLTRPRSPEGAAPERRAASIRRTSSIDVTWPEGRGGEMQVDARARDLITPPSGGPMALGAAAYRARLDASRSILAIADDGAHPELTRLVGERPGRGLRAAITHSLPSEQVGGTPLYLILDDLAGASLVAPWAWSCWDPDWEAEMKRMKSEPALAAVFSSKENVCSGLATGSSGLTASSSGTHAGSLVDPDDPLGWHDLLDSDGPGFRRARRIDLWREGQPDDERISIDAHFQDSGLTPEGDRSVVHEYRLWATADAATGRLVTITATPRVLPFPECVPAAANVARLVGTPLDTLRATVLERLRGPAGCTHLNDALRALAEVPILAAALAIRPAEMA